MSQSVNYDEVAASYDRRYDNTQYPGTEDALREHVANTPGLEILEVGCGTGYWLSLLLDWGARLTGLDSSTGMLERAAERVPKAQLVRGRAESLPFPAQSFDRVFCVNAFHHFSDKAGFLREAARVLRPEGRLFTVGMDPQRALDRWYIYEYFEGTRALDERRFPACDEICASMRAAGFIDCRHFEVERIDVRKPAREAIAAGALDRHSTSQLTILSREAYERGVARIHAELASHEARGESFRLHADVHLFGTLASLP
jgi:SAM-dependent methyltransferase